MKVNLIFPVAGEAVRFGGTFKPFLSIGDKTFIEVTFAPFEKWSNKINTVNFICTQEQEDAYNVTSKIQELIDHPSVNVIIIPHQTPGPYQTIKQGIEIGNITGKGIVCDCDHTLNVDNIFENIDSEYDAVVPTWNIEPSEWKNWSKVVHDGKRIQMICEKERVSSDELYVDGIIGCILFDSIEDKFNNDNYMYVSNSLQSLLLSGKNIKTVEVTQANFYGDKHMLETYVNILRKRCTIFCDIDGVLIKHNPHSKQILSDNKLIDGYDRLQQWGKEGHRVILTTARSEKHRSTVVVLLDTLGIQYDELVMGLPAGPRVLINDHKPSKLFTNQATSMEVVRDSGLQHKDITHIIRSNDIKVIKQFEGGSFAKTYLLELYDNTFVRKHIIKTDENIIHYDKLVRQMDDLQRLNFLWPNCTPHILAKRDTDFDFCFDMEYLQEYKTISECSIDDQIISLQYLLSGMDNNVYSMKKEIEGISWVDNFLSRKIYPKFAIYEKSRNLKTLIDSKEVIINGSKFSGLRDIISKIDKHIIKPKHLRPIHGDFTFENVMWNGEKIKLIDMDGSDPFDAAELDLGKMCQSVFSRFNEWKNIKMDIKIEGNTYVCNSDYFDIKQDSIYEVTIKEWSHILNDDNETIKTKGIFYMCMWFIRFVPFRIKQSENHGIFALIMAIIWLSKLIGEEK